MKAFPNARDRTKRNLSKFVYDPSIGAPSEQAPVPAQVPAEATPSPPSGNNLSTSVSTENTGAPSLQSTTTPSSSAPSCQLHTESTANSSCPDHESSPHRPRVLVLDGSLLCASSQPPEPEPASTQRAVSSSDMNAAIEPAATPLPWHQPRRTLCITAESDSEQFTPRTKAATEYLQQKSTTVRRLAVEKLAEGDQSLLDGLFTVYIRQKMPAEDTPGHGSYISVGTGRSCTEEVLGVPYSVRAAAVETWDASQRRSRD